MSTLKVGTIADTSGSNGSTPAAIANGIAKCWVNFNGTGTVAIRASYNVSSITDNGTGDYTVNFTNAMADANYSVAGTATLNASSTAVPRIIAPAAVSGFSSSNCQVRTADDIGNYNDCAAVCVAIFR